MNVILISQYVNYTPRQRSILQKVRCYVVPIISQAIIQSMALAALQNYARGRTQSYLNPDLIRKLCEKTTASFVGEHVRLGIEVCDQAE